ncbi:MAG: hypothetical protein Q9O24_02280 [Gammaproteobacteria bacterium]|nr:hypothetical protein [Gammaproteobacteria bacterium]
MKSSLLAGLLLMAVMQPLAAEYAPKTWSQDIKNLNRLHNPVLLDIPVMNYTGINYYTMKYWPKGTIGLLQPLNSVGFDQIEPAAGAAESREVRGLSLYRVMNNMGLSQSVLEERP